MKKVLYGMIAMFLLGTFMSSVTLYTNLQDEKILNRIYRDSLLVQTKEIYYLMNDNYRVTDTVVTAQKEILKSVRFLIEKHK